MSQREGTAKAALFSHALRALAGSGEEVRAWWVPGRIEFLGTHTDYAGGPSLLCAVERGFAVVASPRRDSTIRIIEADSGERVEAEPCVDSSRRREHWSNYPLTVLGRITRNFPGAYRGLDVAFASDLPRAAGLSSSSALIVATFLAIADVNDLASRHDYRESIHSTEDLAGYLGAMENGSAFGGLGGDRGVGTQGGSEDHTAILCSRAGALVQYSFAPLRFERTVSVPGDYLFVIASSGVTAEKTGNALSLYNRAAARANAALATWRSETGSTAPSLTAALAEPSAIDLFRQLLRGRRDLLERVEQIREEGTLVREAGDALTRGDISRLGELVDSSQRNAERWLGNQVPETIALARAARELGAAAASAFGAGFGGSVYALVRATEAGTFREGWADRYRKEFPHRSTGATFFLSAAGSPAIRL